MKYISLQNTNYKKTFREAVLQGMAPGNGLFFPEHLPQFDTLFFEKARKLKLHELAAEVLWPYVSDDFSRNEIDAITQEVFSFDIPLKQVEKNIFSLELYHGPTLAFKDVGARFLSRCMQRFAGQTKKRVLVATSGDTGSAVAHGFYNIPNIDVFVLFPKGKVSKLQQKQFSTLGNNIQAIAVGGTFDDCQILVKQALGDEKYRHELGLTSANSINIARWLPQSVYYYWAYLNLPQQFNKLTFAVPSGNLGNLTAGVLAKHSGLAIDRFIAATNANKVIANYLENGEYKPHSSRQTIANAMDVGNPNNFSRMLQFYNRQFNMLSAHIEGASYSDSDILGWMNRCYRNTGYKLDPHGATAYASLKETDLADGEAGVFLETAHPAKFIREIQDKIDYEVDLPEKLVNLMNKKDELVEMEANYDTFKAYLVNQS